MADPGRAVTPGQGIVALSSAVDLPGVGDATDLYRVAAPLLMITGDAGTALRLHAHRSPYDRSPPGDRMLVIFEGKDCPG